MFANIGNIEGGLFDEFRRLQRETDQLFEAPLRPNGIRAMARGTYPPINVGSTPNQIDVYLFAVGVDPKRLELSIQKNLLTVAGQRNLDTE